MDNVTRVLTAAGADWSRVVRVGVYLSRREDFAAFNAIYASYARDPLPARTTIVCDLLAGIAVEVDCVAALPREEDAECENHVARNANLLKRA